MKDILAKITNSGTVDEGLVREIVKDVQRILITSDVDIKLVKEISEEIKKNALDEKLPVGVSRKEHLIKLVYDKLVEILGSEKYSPRFDKHKILLVGLYGSGKTTTTGKLGLFYSKRGIKTAVATTDTWRPAAYEQLKQLSEQIKIPHIGKKSKNSNEMLKTALDESKKYDVLIVDSAGRDSLSDELIKEIKELKEKLKPDETYLVISADIGQTAIKQAETFEKTVDLTGVIVTKADSSGKAGGALSACNIAKVPVAFIGTGEKMQDFEIFDAKKFVARLLGFPDIGGLLKKVKEAVEDTDFSPEDLMKGEYTLKTFYKQLEATKKMGPLNKVVEMMGISQLPKELVETSEHKMKKYKTIMDSMTEQELNNPDLIKSSRVTRIAKGSGSTDQEVKALLKQFNMGKKMVGKLKKGKMKGIQNMMKGMSKMKFR